MSFYEAYGELASITSLSDTLRAGRLPAQVESERLILRDVLGKLEILPQSRLLEIGCGPGNLLIPLSFCAAEVVGIDHPRFFEGKQKNFGRQNVTVVGGEFPEVTVAGRYDKILIYSVLHYLAGLDAAISFVSAAVDLLSPGGALLVGDLPNTDKKFRFLATEEGRAFEAEWKAKTARAASEHEMANVQKAFAGRSSIGGFTDAQIAALLLHVRGLGFETYLLPQPTDLPFGHTREDLLVVRP